MSVGLCCLVAVSCQTDRSVAKRTATYWLVGKRMSVGLCRLVAVSCQTDRSVAKRTATYRLVGKWMSVGLCRLIVCCVLLSGLVTSTISSELFQAAQPALLYLVPFTLLPLFVMAYLKVSLYAVSLHHFTCWISPLAQRDRYWYWQASRSNYRGYLHVLKYLLFIVIIFKQKAVMQMNMLAPFSQNVRS